ncbi:MAG: TlpA disulfide reductase family protein, partial [Planctomycetota bacterium]
YRCSVVVVDYWGTWCPPCRAEVPHFIALQEEYGDRGLQILGLNYKEDSVSDVAAFAEENGINYPVGIGNKRAKSAVPEFGGYPTTVFVGRDGTVRLKVTGAKSKAYLEAVVKALLDEPAPTD